MVDDVGICNLALGRAKVATRIESLEESSAEARACRSVYSGARDRLLAAYPWPWVRASQALALLDVTPTNWAYAYALPADYLQPLELDNGLRASRPDQRLEYEIVAGEAGPELHTDQPDAVLRYVRASSDPGLWSPAFRDALAWAVAADLALVLAKDEQLAAFCQRAAQIEASRAAAHAANTGQSTQPAGSALRAIRR